MIAVAPATPALLLSGTPNTSRTYRLSQVRDPNRNNHWIDGGVRVCDATGGKCKVVNLVDVKAEDCGPWLHPAVVGYQLPPHPAPANSDRCAFPSEDIDYDVSADGRTMVVHRNEVIESQRQWIEIYDVASNKRISRRVLKDEWADRDRVYGIQVKWVGPQALVGNGDRVFRFNPLAKGPIALTAASFSLCETCGAESIVGLGGDQFAIPGEFGGSIVFFNARSNAVREVTLPSLPANVRMHPQLKLHVDGSVLYVAFESPSRLASDIPDWDGRVVAIDTKRMKVLTDVAGLCR